MNICIATNLYFPSIGGVPNYYLYLAQVLEKAGHRILVLRPDFSAVDKNDVVEVNGAITVVSLCRTFNKHNAYLKQFFRPGDYEAYSWIAMGYAMKEWLLENRRTHKIDLIEVPDYGGIAVLLKDDRLPPVLIGGHAFISQLSRHIHVPANDHTKVLKKLEWLSFKYAEGIVAHSKLNQQDLATLIQKEIFFSRAPWIPPTFPQNRKTEEGKHIVVNGLHMIKGPELMIEATGLIAKKEPGFKLLWMGGDTYSAPRGQLVSAYLQKKFPHIWEHNFIWKGQLPHDQILEETATAATAFIPAVWETFNYFALEASYLSTPLIMTDHTGSEYLFKDRPGVTITSAGDATAIASAYLERRSNINKEQHILTREYLADYFSVANILRDRLPIYERLKQEGPKYCSAAIQELSFLKDYLTFSRKTYYLARKKIKSISGKK